MIWGFEHLFIHQLMIGLFITIPQKTERYFYFNPVVNPATSGAACEQLKQYSTKNHIMPHNNTPFKNKYAIEK